MLIASEAMLRRCIKGLLKITIWPSFSDSGSSKKINIFEPESVLCLSVRNKVGVR